MSQVTEKPPVTFTRTPIANPDGVPSFTDDEDHFGKVDRQTIWNVLSLAKTLGWRTVIGGNLNSPAKKYIGEPTKTMFLELVGIPPGQKVLDLAAGWGSLAIQIAKRYSGVEVHAFDRTLEGLLFLNVIKEQERLSNLHIAQVNAYDVPVADEAFDVVFYVGALERIGESMKSGSPMDAQLRVLREIKRLLSKGGKAVIGVDNKFSYKYLKGKKDSSGRRFATILPKTLRTPVYSESGYRKLFMGKTGFRSVETFVASPDCRYPKAISNPRNVRAMMIASHSNKDPEWIKMIPDWLLRRIAPCFYFVVEK